MDITQEKSPWPIALKYGLILSFALILVDLALYLVNPNADLTKFSITGLLRMILGAAIGIYVLYLAAKQRRDVDFDGYMSYGKAFGFMLLVALPATFIVSLYSFIFSNYINPEMMNKIMEAQSEAMYQKGMSEEQIELSMQMMQKMNKPFIAVPIGMIAQLFFSVIYALIAAIFVKKELQNID
jgi:hypothetical protein